MRTRAPLRALTPDPRSRAERHSDPDPRGNRHELDRYDQGNGAHGYRWRRNVLPVEHAVLRPAAVSGDHRRRRTGPEDRQASSGLRARAGTLVGRAKRGSFLRLLRHSPSIRDHIPVTSQRSKSPIMTWWGTTVSWPGSKPSPCAALAATRSVIFEARPPVGSRH